MAGAMLTRWLACGLDPAGVIVIRPSGQPPAPGIRTLSAVPEDGPPPALLLLGFKPHQLGQAAPAYLRAVVPDTILLSILAATPVAMLRDSFPMLRSIVRSMPNLPVAIGKGIVAVYHEDESDEARETLAGLLASLGLVEWLGDEAQFDAVTALAGCGPAFLFRFVTALQRAAIAQGIEPGAARRLATATAEGAALMAAASAEDATVLADQVASRGGMTAAGLAILDSDQALDRLIAATIAASVARGKEMERA